MMKLSTAVLKGSKGIEQGFHALRTRDGRYCALGAACRATGIKVRVGQLECRRLAHIYPFLGTLTNAGKTLADQIVKKNDCNIWSFKRIANWLKRKGY